MGWDGMEWNGTCDPISADFMRRERGVSDGLVGKPERWCLGGGVCFLGG